MAQSFNPKNMTQKEHFRLMYDRLKTVQKGVYLNKVLCSTLMYIAGGKSEALGSLKSLANFLLSFDVRELKQGPLQDTLVVFGYYPSRKDHRELMENIAKRIGECTYLDMSKWNRRHLKISPKNILKGLRDGFWNMSGVGMSAKERLLLAANLCFYLNTLDEISKVDFSNTHKFLCLANTLDLENLFTQFLKTKGIKTYSLMEGAYFIQENELPITNIAFENLSSDIQLCWGQFSKDQFIKYGYAPSKMIVAGYPKNVEGEPMKDNNPYKKGVVLLSQYFLERQNLSLIDILANYTDKIEFSLKLHPSLDFNFYSSLANEKGMSILPKDMTLKQCVDNTNFDFAIAINSTAYYEALMRGLPCMRFYDGSYTPLAGCDDEFADFDTFIHQLNRIKSLPTNEYQKEVDNALMYAVGWGIDEYKNILA